ncbi:MAG: Glu/Leu/Phe/Val dehydrogenase, partial [Spirochaetales bacterium]|nr:Glu/Leu/Phe/Val dehydrogenase [Spirochaetales bacterium]
GSFDAEYTKSGVSVVSITKSGRSDFKVPNELWSDIKKMLKDCEQFSFEKSLKHGVTFLNNIQLDYLSEEVTAHSPGVRIKRHMEYYEKAMESNSIVVIEDEAQKKIGDLKENLNEKRLAISVKNPHPTWVINMLKAFEFRDISMNRCYYDLIEGDDSVGILSVYLEPEIDTVQIKDDLHSLTKVPQEKNREESEFKQRVDGIIRALTTISPTDEGFKDSIENLRNLCIENSDLSVVKEYNNFYLNSVTDFFKAADFAGISRNMDVMSLLLKYEDLDEFFVSCREDDKLTNKPGFRAKHNSARGPSKGGLRIDSIVRYDEVAALSFMMTWKCARSRILFGGGKGGLKLNPADFKDKKMDFFETLSNFGRSIFTVTGPAKDVPAGDVGCGGTEIGHLFEGFKSALRDLALLAYGIKKGVSQIGNKIISVEEARSILYNNFDIDYLDSSILKELSTNEEYLNLVTAAQITGKPKMGIAARTGATGRGLCYSILQSVTNLFLDGKWESSQPISSDENQLLLKASEINEESLIESEASPLLTRAEWEILHKIIYPKLLLSKRVAVQGSGKVGSSIMKELTKYGVNIIAVADAGGMICGHNLNLDEMLVKVNGPERSVINCTQNVTRRVPGAKEGAEIVEIECDILIPAALENAITQNNAYKINTKIVACGSNGPCSSKAELILNSKGVLVIYDFLANGAGVTASYFEWLRNLYDRFKYEANVIRREDFTFEKLEKYIMPEFNERIKRILLEDEGEWTTNEWNLLIRDIVFSEINDDYRFSKDNNISMKSAGFVNSMLRVLTATLIKLDTKQRGVIWSNLEEKTKTMLFPYFNHPEAGQLAENIEVIKKELFT